MIGNGSNTKSVLPAGLASALAALMWLALHSSVLHSSVVFAHEGHPTIPTTGAAVHGDVLLLSPGAVRAIGLETSKITLADMPSVVRANGSISTPWRQHAFVTTLIKGIVTDVSVRPGEAVKQGQVLACISSLELEQIQLDMLQAAEDFSHYDHRFQQQEPLVKSGVISGKKLFETRKNRARAATRLHIAITKLNAFGFDREALDRIRSSGETVSHIDITSPIGGRVVDADLRVGQSVAPDKNLFHVIDNSKVMCVADVLETGSLVVGVGQPVKVYIAAMGGEPLPATISHIDIAIDEKKRALRVAIELNNHDLRLRPGMSARIVVQVSESRQAIVCPREALIRVGEEHQVLLKQGEGKYVRRKVRVGRVGRERVEILKGLFPGDYVTTTGTHLLSSLFAQSTGGRTDARTASHNKTTTRSNDPGVHSLAAIGVVEVPKSNKFSVTSRIGGRVSRIFVAQGQHVTKGQPLVEIESRELFQLQLDLLEKSLDLRWAEETLELIGPLADIGGVPRTKALQLRNDVRKQRLAVAVLMRRLVAIGLPKERLEKLANADVAKGDLTALVSKTITFHAPHAGRLSHFGIVPGEAVVLQDDLFEVNDLSHVWVKAYLFEDHASQVKAEQRVEVRFVSDAALRMTGRIVRTAPTANARRVFPVWLELDNANRSLRDGMLAHVRIETGKPTPATMTPATMTPATMTRTMTPATNRSSSHPKP